MSKLLIVVDRLSDWKGYYPSQDVITLSDYLGPTAPVNGPIRVINLARDYGYLSQGYYCSLLAEARNHRVLPSITTLNEFINTEAVAISSEQLQQLTRKLPSQQPTRSFSIYFGQADQPDLQPLAARIHEELPCPILHVHLRYRGSWEISRLRIGSLNTLKGQAQDDFATALNHFSRKIWRKPKLRKRFRYELAILVNPQEKLPPSNRLALSRFRTAGRALGLDVGLIGPNDLHRLAEFDALFIRATTSPNDYSYRFARRAMRENMVVIDDPVSIMRCTNKVYLANLLTSRGIPAPASLILDRSHPEQLEQAIERLGLPMVLKIPDGSFSRGVERVTSPDELRKRCDAFFRHSALILAQEYIYTDYDWRIGILEGQPLYACKYFMSRGHWQIYQHNARGQVRSGDFETLPLDAVPEAVLKAARDVTRPIGQGLYGVDLKLVDNQVYVIEVNDNPSIDAGVEDQVLGKQLYTSVMSWFLRQLDHSRGSQAAALNY